MKLESYFYNCSPEYIHSIDPALFEDIKQIILHLPKRQTQPEINADLFWLLASYDWNFDTILPGTGTNPPDGLDIKQSLNILRERNRRDYCLT